MKRLEQICFAAISSTYVLLVTVLAILLLASLGNADPLSKSLDRWTVPVREDETIAINELNCVEDFLTIVPKDSKVNLFSNAGPYWEQRFLEISFPRISVVNNKSKITIHLESVETPSATTQCGGVFLGVDEDE
jgi:hypothetical protein